MKLKVRHPDPPGDIFVRLGSLVQRHPEFHAYGLVQGQNEIRQMVIIPNPEDILLDYGYQAQGGFAADFTAGGRGFHRQDHTPGMHDHHDDLPGIGKKRDVILVRQSSGTRQIGMHVNGQNGRLRCPAARFRFRAVLNATQGPDVRLAAVHQARTVTIDKYHPRGLAALAFSGDPAKVRQGCVKSVQTHAVGPAAGGDVITDAHRGEAYQHAAK